MVSNPIFKSSMILAFSNVGIAVLSFLRNILVARLVSVEDFGVASTFAIVTSLVAMANNFAVDKFLIQTSGDDVNSTQRSLQFFEFSRGVLNSIITFFLAGLFASYFENPELAWAYQLLALIPLLRGLTHLDFVRFQRQMKFMSLVKLELIPHLLSLSLFPVLSMIYDNYLVFLYMLLSAEGARLLLSHFLAENRYGWKPDLSDFKTIFQFGWPLILNNVLFFCVSQGEKSLVGLAIGLEELGWFSATFSLAFLPAMVLIRTIQSLFLPIFSRISLDEDRFREGVRSLMIITATLGCLLSIGTIILGPLALKFIFGSKYEAGASLVGLLGITQALRVTRSGLIVPAISKKITSLPLLANSFRVLSFGAGAVALFSGFNIYSVIFCSLLAEFAALAFSFHFLNKKLGLHIPQTRNAIILIFAGLTIIGYFVTDVFNGTNPLNDILIGGGVSLLVCCASWLLFANAFRWILNTKTISFSDTD